MPDYSEADAVMAAQTGTQTGLTPRSMASEADAVMAAQTGVWGCGEEVAHSTPAVNAFVRNGDLNLAGTCPYPSTPALNAFVRNGDLNLAGTCPYPSTPAVNAFVRNGGDDYRRLQARAAALDTSVRLSGDPSRRRDVACVLEVARRIEAYLMGDK